MCLGAVVGALIESTGVRTALGHRVAKAGRSEASELHVAAILSVCRECSRKGRSSVVAEAFVLSCMMWLRMPANNVPSFGML